VLVLAVVLVLEMVGEAPEAPRGVGEGRLLERNFLVTRPENSPSRGLGRVQTCRLDRKFHPRHPPRGRRQVQTRFRSLKTLPAINPTPTLAWKDGYA
jgi:hypothetical protein